MKRGRTLIPTIPGRVIVHVSTGPHDEGITGDFPADAIDAVLADWQDGAEDDLEDGASLKDVAKKMLRTILRGPPAEDMRAIIAAAALWLATEGSGGRKMLTWVRKGDCVVAVTVRRWSINARLIRSTKSMSATAH